MELSTDMFPKRLQNYFIEKTETKAYRRMVKNLLCLSYAYVVKSKISELFVCLGCENRRASQHEHECLMYSPDVITDLHFDEALTYTSHLEVENTWREFTIQSCIPLATLQRLMQDERLRDENYVKQSYSEKIKKYVKKIGEVQTYLTANRCRE